MLTKPVLRVRPSNPDDASVPPRFRQVLLHPTSPTDVRVDVDPAALAGQTPTAGGPSKRHPTFAFDHVLGEEASQEDLFDCTARDVVDDFLKGHNVTFLA
jgi:kinesin family protein 4/21/27